MPLEVQSSRFPFEPPASIYLRRNPISHVNHYLTSMLSLILTLTRALMVTLALSSYPPILVGLC